VAKDFLHSFVKAALVQAGWVITHDPYTLNVGGVDMEIDLGAECVIAAERQGLKVAIEVKSFLKDSSAISEFHRALGQFINYRIALREEDSARVLYLAIPLDAFNTFFQLDFPKSVIAENNIKLLVYNSLDQGDLLWIPEIMLK
jgi:XisH protein